MADWPSLEGAESLREVSEAVQRLRGRVRQIRDRETADAAWAKISEVTEFVRQRTAVSRRRRRHHHRAAPPDEARAPAVPSPPRRGAVVSSEEEEEGGRAVPSPRPKDSLVPLDGSTVLVIICFERAEALRRCLASVVSAHTCGGSRVLVSQDGRARTNGAIEAAVDDFSRELEAKCQGESLVTLIRHDAQRPDGSGYHKLSRHFAFALGRAFADSSVQRAIVLEEDLEVSFDFFALFGALAPILDADATLLAASAWNDNGQAGHAHRPDRVVRSDFFPGLGWMLTRAVWQELEPKWPPAYWDDWLREPEQRKGRHILRPEVCRTFHQLSGRGTSNNQYGDFLAKIRLYRGDPPIEDFVAASPSSSLAADLRMEAYDAALRDQLQAATPLALPARADKVAIRRLLDEAGRGGSVAVRIEYRGLDDRDPAAFPALARRLGIMDNIKAGVPRTAYRGVVDFWIDDTIHVFLSPPLAKVHADLFRLVVR